MKESTLTHSLPADWYYTQEQYLAEKKNIFQKDWVFLGHAQQIPEPGDYFTCDIMGIPVAALRDEAGNLQVLLNICRHRAAPLLTEKHGKLAKPVLMCQYHGWCYHTDGSFKHAPFLTTTTENLNLKKIHFTEARGMIFVCFAEQPETFNARKAAILKEMDDAKFNIDGYRYNRQIIRTGNFNWKTWIEGFQECYHCPTVHPVFNKDFHLSKYEVHNKDRFSVHTCPRREASSSGSFEGLWLWMFPNCGMPCYEKVYYSLRINPTSATTTELIYTFFTNEKFTAEDAENFFAFVKQITDEDATLCENVQLNLEQTAGTALFPHGYLHASRENGVKYFHDLIRSAVAAAPALTEVAQG